MAGRLSYSIAINLLTENFKKGTNTVKAGFKSMQMQVLAFAAVLGAGSLGLGNLVSSLINAARETSRFNTALKNVSGSMAQFADNQRFLYDLAKKYGLELSGLTESYAKFTASATTAGVTIADQKKIFESVSRASTAFSLSADENKGVMLALSQMMGKGKISSEELRKQMGEKLPVAMAAMAKAAGTSMAGLEKMLKKGELMSATILPKFAEALNEMIPDVDTDNLESSINRLKNAFADIATGLNVEGNYKSLIDNVTKLIVAATENIKNVIVGIITVIAFVVANGLTKILRNYNATATEMVSGAQKANAQLTAATAKRVAAEKALDNAKLNHSVATGTAQVKAAERVNKAQILFARAVVAEDRARIAAQQAAAASNISVWNKSFNVVKLGTARLTIALKSMWNTFAPALVISAIVGLVGYFRNMREEANRIKNIFNDYKAGASNLGNSKEINELQTLMKIANDINKSYDERVSAISTINQRLGTNYSLDKDSLKINGDINEKIAQRIKLLEEQAKVDYYSSKKVEAQDKLNALYRARGGERAFNFQFQNALQQRNTGGINIGPPAAILREMDEAVKLREVIADAEANLTSSMAYVAQHEIKPTVTPTNGDDDKKTDLQKAEGRYAKSIEELNARREVEKMTLQEYNKALDELNRRYYIEARGTQDRTILESKYFNKLKEAVENPTFSQSQYDFEKVQKDHYDAEKVLTNQFEKGAITQKEYQQELKSLNEKTIKAAAALGDIGTDGQAFIAALMIALRNVETAIASGIKVNPKTRDTTFDYKKSGTDILGEQLKIAQDYQNELAKAFGKEAEELAQSLTDAMEKNDLSLEDALKLAEAKVGVKALIETMAGIKSLESQLKTAEIKEDVEALRKEFNEGLYSGIKNIASSSDRVVSAFSNLKDVMNDVDASNWERIMAVWNAMTNTIDAFLSIIAMVEKLTELSEKLTKAKQAEAAADEAAAAVKVQSTATGVAADLTAAAVKKTTAAGEVAANTGVAASEAGASAAKLPFPANLIAIGAAIAGVIALFASIPKFANGGIVGGNSFSGDKILAGVNSGEMILNQGQQSKLFSILNSGQKSNSSNSGSGGEVVFKVKGSELVGVLNNFNKRNGRIG